MSGMTRAREALGRIFNGAHAGTAGAQPQRDDMRAAAGLPRVTRRRRGLRVFVTWITARLDAARQRNEEAMIEETHDLLRAKRRSLGLMMSLLSPEQRLEFETCRYFHVIGGSTGTLYRIRVAAFANIDIPGPHGRTMYRLCAHPAGDVPVYDVMAAQLLHLQDPAAEKAFLRHAHVHPVVAPARSASGTFWVP
jgi:hypothetical protein